jgi:hypothetical protein
MLKRITVIVIYMNRLAQCARNLKCSSSKTTLPIGTKPCKNDLCEVLCTDSIFVLISPKNMAALSKSVHVLVYHKNSYSFQHFRVLFCLFFDLGILISPLVSSNSSSYTTGSIWHKSLTSKI